MRFFLLWFQVPFPLWGVSIVHIFFQALKGLVQLRPLGVVGDLCVLIHGAAMVAHVLAPHALALSHAEEGVSGIVKPQARL